MHHRIALVALILVAFTRASPVHKQTDVENIDYRLPTSLEPEHYVICLVPYLENEGNTPFTFDGSVTIRFKVITPTDNITLHAHELSINETKTEVIEVESGTKLMISSHTDDPVRQFLHIHVAQTLEADKTYEIHIQYNGVLNEEMNGFYRSFYMEGDVTKWMATTQFQATFARKAFPCFDEPAMKATFTLNIARYEHPDLHILSNMPRMEISEPDASIDNRVWDTFEKTEHMSTYLVAFIISEFQNISEDTFSIWARRGAIEQAQYSLEIGPQALRVLEEYTGINYTLPKLDNVAISDFSAGAMENWGLITYREASLLYDPTQSTESNKQRVATVVAHELVHMWFGDLVTPAWWEYTWLSEGFARYLQCVTIDQINPDWRLMEQFVVDHLQPILRSDSLISAPQLSNPCGSPSEITANFGTITYSKGGSVLRMLNHVLTDKTFKEGLHNYLTTNQYTSTVPDQLFMALNEVAIKDDALPVDLTVKQIMDSWTLQPGFPFITVTRDIDSQSIILSQERFLLKPDPANPDTKLWWVPLSWTKESDASNGPAAFLKTTATEWMRGEKSITLSAEGIDNNEWVIFNNLQTGYYRVAYDEHNWKLILTALQSAQYENIHVVNRAQIIDDALNLARSGIVKYENALDSTLYLEEEVDHIAWVAAFNGFAYLDSRLVSSAGFSDFQHYVLQSLQKLYTTVTFNEGPTDSQTTILSRVNVLTWACKYDQDTCVKNANEEFSDYMINDKSVSPNKKSVVYCTALRQGGSDEWNFLWGKYSTSNLATEQVLILSALGCTNDLVTLNSYLMMSIDENSGIRKQDAPSVFSSVYNNPKGVDTALDFLIEYFKEIESHYVGTNALANAITGIAGKLTTEEQVDKLRQFIIDNEQDLGDSASSAGAKAIEAAEADLEWTMTYSATILTWMSDNVKGAANRSFEATFAIVLLATFAQQIYAKLF